MGNLGLFCGIGNLLKTWLEAARSALLKFVRFVLEWLRSEHLQRAKRLMKVWTARYPVEFFAGIGGIVLILWVLSPMVMWLFFGNGAGPKGDSFGALTSLFTGAAFVGLIATLMQQQREIRMQRQDLKLQRDEMKASREELSGQKQQMELQNQSLQQQMFEQTFFNLLNVFNQYIADLVEDDAEGDLEPRRGRDQLELILQKMHSAVVYYGYIETSPAQFGGETEAYRAARAKEQSEKLGQEFLKGTSRHANDLNSYFRLLYNILKLVDQSDVGQKKTYTNILRAQLSDSELQLIALNCARLRTAKLQFFVNRYEILKHLPSKLDGLEIQAACDEIRRQETEEKASE